MQRARWIRKTHSLISLGPGCYSAESATKVEYHGFSMILGAQKTYLDFRQMIRSHQEVKMANDGLDGNGLQN